MTWIKLGIVLFMLLQNVLSQQGYNYPKPDTPFPERIPSPGKPGYPSRLDQTSGSKSQSPGDYHSQPDRSGVPTNFLTPDGSAEDQGQSGIQGPSTGHQPIYPGRENIGSQGPSSNTPSSGNQQGYKYPAPQKPFSGTPSSEGQQNTPGYSNNKNTDLLSGGYPSSQQGFPKTNGFSGSQTSTPGQQNSNGYSDNKHTDLLSGGYPSSQQGFPKTNGFSGSQTPKTGQQSSSGYPGQQSLNSQLPFTDIPEPSEYPDVSKPSSQFPAKFSGSPIHGNGRVNQGDSQGLQPFGKPSGYPDVSKPSSQFPVQFPGNTIGGNGRVDQGESQGLQLFGKHSGFPDVGKPSSQFPSKFPGSAIGGNGRGDQGESRGLQSFDKPSSLNGAYPSGSPGYSQGKPQFSGQQTNELPRPHGNFQDAETPRKQFPGSNRGLSTHGTDEADRDQTTSARPGASSGSSDGYTDNAPLGGSKFPGQQRPQGYPGAESPARPQFSAPGSENTQFQPTNQNGQKNPEKYPEAGRPAGRFPGTTPTGPFRQGTQSQNGFQQRPSGDYLPPQQGSGNFPSPGKTSRPQFPNQGSRTEEELGKPVDQPRQPAFQPGSQYSKPANQGDDSSFPSNGQNKPASPFQRPEFPTSAQPGNSRIPSGDSFRPEQSSGTDTSKAPETNQAGDRPTSFPGSSRPQFGGPGGLQNQFPGHQGDANESTYEDGDYSAIPGEPDVDYPVLSLVPETSFRCEDQQFPGYYADVETRCQAFHVCANDKKYDFLCPNGTIFHQEYLVCVWWNQFDCNTAQSLYGINENIYDFSITGIQQTGGIPVPGSDFPSAQTPGGFPNQPHGPARPGTPGTKPSFPGQTPDNLDNGERPEFPSGASRPHNGYPSGQQTPGYPSQKPQTESNGYPTPGNGTQGSRFPSPDSKTPFGQAPGTYPSGRPQGSTFPSDSDRPNIPSFGQPQTQQSNGYPPQGSRFPSSSQHTGIQAPGQTTQDRYPGDRPQRPGFPSESQTPEFGPPQFQRPSGYPSGPESQGSRFPTSGSTQAPSGSSQGPEGYPSGKPQGPSFPSGSSRPGAPTFGHPQSQRPGSYPSPGIENPQGPSFPSGSGTPGTSTVGQPQSQRPGSYPSPGSDTQGSRFYPLEPTQSPSVPTQEPEGYQSGKPQGPRFPSSSARPGTPSFGQPQSQQPSGYPSSGKDTNEPRFPSSSVGSGSQTPTRPTQNPLEGYPSGRPQGPGFQPGSSRPQTPAYSQTGSQSPSGHPSTENDSQGARFPPSGPGSQATGEIAQDSKTPGDYPTERPQASFKPAFGAPDAPVSGTSQFGGSQGYPSGRPQITGSSAGRPQPFSSSEDANQGNNRYSSGTTEPRRPGSYPEQQPERYPSQEGGSTSGSTTGSQGSPGRPGTPFPGSPQPHHPTREYLPPVSRK